jgi:hypothetical protein
MPGAMSLPLLLVLSLALAAPAPPVLTIESIRVEPASPEPDVLCHLAVTLRNRGDRPASALELAVKLGGNALPAYRDRVILKAVEPGATRELRLYNFWSTEPARPAPADGKLVLEVALTRAAWMQRETKDGATVWTPAGPVAGLPSVKTLTLTLAKPKR